MKRSTITLLGLGLASSFLLVGCGGQKTDTTIIDNQAVRTTVEAGDTVQIEYRLGWENEENLFASNGGDTLTASSTDFLDQYLQDTVTISEDDIGPFADIILGKSVGESSVGVLSSVELGTATDHNEYLIQNIPSRVATSQGVELEIGNVVRIDDKEATIVSVLNDDIISIDQNLRHTYTPVRYDVTVVSIESL